MNTNLVLEMKKLDSKVQVFEFLDLEERLCFLVIPNF